jgi:hypothetical protein
MKPHVSWLEVGLWTLLTAVGVLLAGGLHFPGDYGTRVFSLVETNWPGGLVGFIFGAVSGLFIAGPQALRLRAWGGPARAWIGYNVLGFGLIHALADAVPYRPLVIGGGGVVLAVCQWLALRHSLIQPGWWLAVAAAAWWLAFGLTAGRTGYNLVVIGLLLGAATGTAQRLLLIPAEASGPKPASVALSRPR